MHAPTLSPIYKMEPFGIIQVKFPEILPHMHIVKPLILIILNGWKELVFITHHSLGSKLIVKQKNKGNAPSMKIFWKKPCKKEKL
jgi:hypothetical protein